MNTHTEFTAWMNAVDKQLERELGLPSDDLPDFYWADMHEDGLTPIEAVACYIEEEAYN